MQKLIDAYIDTHREEMVAQWEALVNLEGKADEPEAMDAVAEHLFRIFSEAGLTCRLQRAHPQAPQVLTGVIGEDRPGKPILFGGHYDTVFRKGQLGEKPFRIDGEGKAHGPGCLDMKGGIIIALYIIKALEAAGYRQRPIRVVFCGDEEGGAYHFDATPLITEAARGCVCAFNMETGPIDNSVCVGRKGGFIGSFSVTGVSAHSGNNFEAGRNAIVEAAYKMLDVDALTDMEKGTHVNVAVAQGGKMWNSVPDRCDVTFSVRLAQNAEIERVLDSLDAIMAKTYIDGTTTGYQRPGKVLEVYEQTDANLAMWAFCNRISEENGFGKMGHVFLGGGSDAVQMAKAGTPTLCSCGVLGEWNHTDREYAVVESLFTRTRLWCIVIPAIRDDSF